MGKIVYICADKEKLAQIIKELRTEIFSCTSNVLWISNLDMYISGYTIDKKIIVIEVAKNSRINIDNFLKRINGEKIYVIKEV